MEGYAITRRQESRISEAVQGAFNAGLYSRFIEYLDASEKTIQTYTRALKQFFTFLQRQGITAPTVDTIRAYKKELTASVKPATVQAYIFVVRKFFSWTEMEGLYPNVAGKIKGAKIDREPKKDYLTSSQVKAVLSEIDRSTIQGKRDYAILALMVTCGLRDIEVSRADKEDLRTVGNNTALFIHRKGGLCYNPRSNRSGYKGIS